jgi:hypothetical protein
MFSFFTTTTAPPWTFSAPDPNNPSQALPGFSGATFTIEFVNVSNNARVAGTGTWSITDVTHGVFQYQLSSTDLANAYATTGSSSPGTAMFDVCVEITIGSQVYDPSPSRIAVRKI